MLENLGSKNNLQFLVTLNTIKTACFVLSYTFNFNFETLQHEVCPNFVSVNYL